MGNPESPFVYVNDKEIGNLRVGDQIRTILPSGRHRISIRSPLLFMPAWEAGALDINVEAGKSYYVRYARTPSGIIVLPGSAHAMSSSGFAVVDEETWRQRK